MQDKLFTYRVHVHIRACVTTYDVRLFHQDHPSTSNNAASMSVRSNQPKINHTVNLHTDTMNRLL